METIVVTDEELGDPEVPRKGDPTQITMVLTPNDVLVLYKGLGEIPAKFSKSTIDSIERQVRSAILGARREALILEKAAAAERIAAAEAKRLKKQERRAAQANGKASVPPTAPATSQEAA